MSRLLISILLLVSIVSCRPVYFSETVIYRDEVPHPEKVIRLDLSSQDLKILPSDIYRYKNLKFLNLSNNPNLDLASIGAFLTEIDGLEVLKLDSNGLNSLPSWIEQLSGLKHISLSYNQGLNLEVAFMHLKHLPFLEKLNLSHNGLTQIPKSIGNLKYLNTIILSYNEIKDAASYSNLAKLRALKFLWLDHNSIEVLPLNIGELDQISELYLDNNQIGFLPAEIENCKGLHILYLGNNRFKELPNEILSMKIYLLAIYGNEIKTISESYQNMKTPMKILILDKNYLDKEQQKVAKKSFTGFFVLSMKNQQ